MGESMVGLVGADRSFTELPLDALQRLISEGRVAVNPAENSGLPGNKIHGRLAAASEHDLEVANRRLTVLQICKHGGKALTCLSEPYVPGRRVTGRRKRYGDGYVGLLPQHSEAGKQRDRGFRKELVP